MKSTFKKALTNIVKKKSRKIARKQPFVLLWDTKLFEIIEKSQTMPNNHLIILAVYADSAIDITISLGTPVRRGVSLNPPTIP